MANGFIVTGHSGKNDGYLYWLPEATTPEDAFKRVAELTNHEYLRVPYICSYLHRERTVDVLVPKGTDPERIKKDYEEFDGARHYWELQADELVPNVNMDGVIQW